MIFKKRGIATSAVLLFVMATNSFADSPSTSSCSQYLTPSDSQFISVVASHSSTANAIAQTLSACHSMNICADITGIDNCSSLLASRAFESTYYANFNGSGGMSSDHNSAALPPSAVFKPAPKSSLIDNNNDDTTTTQTKSSNNNSSSSIHWF